MLIIPAIDLRQGEVVRLTEGVFGTETVYSQSPADVMNKWQKEGAKIVHVVDLDGAKEGARKNLGSLKNILAISKIKIQFGGGLRTFESVDEVINMGVWRVVLGTKAFDTDLISRLVRTFKERIAIGMDIRDGIIQTHGWRQAGRESISPELFSKKLEQMGIKTVICTDISRDGTLKGPNLALLESVLNATHMNVILSGGISDLSDLKQLARIKKTNFEGVIIGKALYERKFFLNEAINVVQVPHE